ncbi:histidine ammonia-lyase [Labeo rohita]|uniref:Histidine ammonia-lyase n=1 Tax=Labeo rohita TaxID=84645 RepID=A0A498MW23_LABRO|nr:histidine ammonia-lyase [Labeo rohita]
MPRFTVHVRDEWLTIPCKDATCSIKWLGFEALKRYIKNKPDNGGIEHIKDVCFAVRRCQGFGLLDNDDTIEDVLEDDDFVELDGNSLTSTDLVNLGKGLYKIKLAPEAEEKVVQSRELLDTIVKENKGLGSPLSPERTRMLLALRINVLAKGHSGVSLETLHSMIQAFNASCLSYVPEKGTGLALINGTQMITSLGAEAVERAEAIARQADIIAALTLEVLKGTTKAFDSDIHELRPHPGQKEVALRFRSLLDSDHHPSEIAESHRFCDRVQDAYTMRCCPQVHGIVNDTIEFVKKIINTEINSATDNPMVFAERGETISGGNFHGEYPAKALDYLAIGVHELASISERRIERLCNPSLSELPAFLVNEGGLNSGFMIAHCTAAALVSENKVLCHPSSIDSLSTSAATEDHVSMGGWAARKALRVVEHVEQVLAIELLAACQGIEFLRPLRTTTPLEKVYDLVRAAVKPWIKDRFMAPDIEAVHRLLVDQKVWNIAGPYIEKYCMEYIPESRPSSPTAFALDPPLSPRKRVRLE